MELSVNTAINISNIIIYTFNNIEDALWESILIRLDIIKIDANIKDMIIFDNIANIADNPSLLFKLHSNKTDTDCG